MMSDGLADLVPVSEELVAEAWRDLFVEVQAERFAMRTLIWVLVIWWATFPLDKALNSIGRLITTIRAKRV